MGFRHVSVMSQVSRKKMSRVRIVTLKLSVHSIYTHFHHSNIFTRAITFPHVPPCFRACRSHPLLCGVVQEWCLHTPSTPVAARHRCVHAPSVAAPPQPPPSRPSPLCMRALLPTCRERERGGTRGPHSRPCTQVGNADRVRKQCSCAPPLPGCRAVTASRAPLPWVAHVPPLSHLPRAPNGATQTADRSQAGG